MQHRFASSVSALLLLLAAACGDDSATTGATSGGGGEGGGDGPSGSTSASTTSSSSTTGSSSSSSTTGTGGAGTGGEGTGGTGRSGTGGSGTGGSGTGGSAGWPDCVQGSFGGVDSTLADVWAADPAVQEPFWVPGIVVTGVSLGGCSADAFCQIFVQQEESFASWDDGAQQAIRVVVAPEVAFRFTDVAVGDRVDLGGEAFRDTSDGANELQFFIRESSPGCLDVVGDADPQPVDVTLDDLTQAAYEDTHGPLLVRLDTVSGRPHQPGEIFALWDTGAEPGGGGIETVTNMSPFFLPGGVFVGFVAEQIVDFASATGVFGQYRPGGGATYETLYVRSMGDAPLAQ